MCVLLTSGVPALLLIWEAIEVITEDALDSTELREARAWFENVSRTFEGTWKMIIVVGACEAKVRPSDRSCRSSSQRVCTFVLDNSTPGQMGVEEAACVLSRVPKGLQWHFGS
jgi:hypothetical protein